MVKNKFLFLFLILFNIPIFAQVNTEKYRNYESTDGVNGIIELDISIDTGNKDKQEIDFEGRIEYRVDSTYNLLVLQDELGWNNGERFANEGLAHLRHVRNLFGEFDMELFGQADYDKSRLLEFRWLIGSSLRHEIVKSSYMRFAFAIGYFFEHEENNLPQTAVHPKTTNHNRWSNYVTWALKLSENSDLAVITYYQPRFDMFSDFRILSENSLIVSLTRKLALAVEFKLRYDSDPPDGIKNIDTKKEIGFSFKF